VIFKEKSRLAPSKFRLALTNGTRPALGNGRFRLNSDIPIKGKMGKNTRVRKRFIGKSILTIPEET
jgi:hypothetical protein